MTLAARRLLRCFVSTLVLLGSAAALLSLPAAAQEQHPQPPAASNESDGTRTIKLALEGELARRLGPAERWQIAISASSSDLEDGRLSKADVQAWNLRLPDGQVLAEIELTVENLKIDLQENSLVSSGRVSLLARVRPEDLASFIERKGGGKVRHVRFALRGDQVDERFSVRAGPFWLPVHRVGMSHVDGNAVYTHAQNQSVAGIRLPRHMLRKLERKINPIVDGSKLPVPVKFEEVGMGNGMLEIRMSLDLAALPARPLPDPRTAIGAADVP